MQFFVHITLLGSRLIIRYICKWWFKIIDLYESISNFQTLEHLPQESREHRRMLAKVRENQKDIVPPVLDPADPDAEQMINDFLCWFGVTEFMEFFDIRNQDDDRANYNQNENCTIS